MIRSLALVMIFSVSRAWADAPTLVDGGDHHERDRRYASAIAMYLQAERELRVETDTSSVQLRKLVKSRIHRLAPRLSSLKVVVPRDAPRLEIMRDGRAVDPDEWNRDMPIDGGTHRIVVRAPGRRTWSTTVTIEPTRDRRVITIPYSVASK